MYTNPKTIKSIGINFGEAWASPDSYASPKQAGKFPNLSPQ